MFAVGSRVSQFRGGLFFMWFRAKLVRQIQISGIVASFYMVKIFMPTRGVSENNMPQILSNFGGG